MEGENRLKDSLLAASDPESPGSSHAPDFLKNPYWISKPSGAYEYCIFYMLPGYALVLCNETNYITSEPA
jgi:hypothetical protein